MRGRGERGRKSTQEVRRQEVRGQSKLQVCCGGERKRQVGGRCSGGRQRLGRRPFWAERVFSGRTDGRTADDSQDGDGSLACAFVLPFVWFARSLARPPARRICIHSHAGGRTDDADCVASSSSPPAPARPAVAAASPSFLPSSIARLCSASICVRANVTLDHLFRCA